MNDEKFKTEWNQLKMKIKEKFNKLTDDDIRQIEGKRDMLIGKIQARYGYERKRAEEELCRYEQSACGCHKEMAHSGASKGQGDYSSSQMKGSQYNQPGRDQKHNGR